MAEYWDAYDSQRKPLGKTIPRGALSPEDGLFHIVVMIITMNSKGKVLCTLRSDDKPKYPGLWEFTAGSVLEGEKSLHAAQRELMEETGIKAGEKELELICTVQETTAFIDCYFLRRDVDIKDIVFQEGETTDARWLGKSEFDNLIAQNKVAFPVYRRYLQLYDFLMSEGFI